MAKNTLIDYQESPHFSVTEISSKIKHLLENNLGYVKIKGEISGFKLATSGHAYFSLKDEKSLIAATCWRHNISKVNFKLEEGLEVIASGRITAYAGQSKYQISVDSLQPAGAGAFMQILKERKAALQKEGLFDPEKKKPIPFFPKTIGVVTSPTGAVIKDIIHRISDRCGARVIIWPVAVQGENSAEEVSKAIDGFNKIAPRSDLNIIGNEITETTLDKDKSLSKAKRPDLIIVARGGGSIEDLWSFNEEIVVRSVYNSEIPVISAIGHETDFTLIDFAADKRAPTPTAAAEFATPVAQDLRYSLRSMTDSISAKLMQRLKYNAKIMQSYDRIILAPTGYFSSYIQKLDEISFRLNMGLPNLIKNKEQILSSCPNSRLLPRKSISNAEVQLSSFSSRLELASNRLLSPLENRLNLSLAKLSSLDYKKVLKRGFAMVRDKNNKIITSSKEAQKSKSLEITMHDGSVSVKLD